MANKDSWFNVEFNIQIYVWELNANFDVWNKWFGFIRRPGLVQVEFLKFQFTYTKTDII